MPENQIITEAYTAYREAERAITDPNIIEAKVFDETVHLRSP